jgi:hypothetical protein
MFLMHWLVKLQNLLSILEGAVSIGLGSTALSDDEAETILQRKPAA